MAKSINMTEGPIFSKMIMYMVPMIICNLLQCMYNAADNIIVSLSNEPDAVGAIGTTASYIGLINNLLIGLSIGTKVVVAKYVGLKKQKSLSEAMVTAIFLSVAFGTIMTFLLIISANPVLAFMGNKGRLLELAVKYTKIYAIGTIFISVSIA